MPTLEDRCMELMESIADKRRAMELVISFVRAADAAQELARRDEESRKAQEQRREAARARKADYRSRLSHAVPGTVGDGTGQSGTKRDTVSPLDPPSVPGSSLTLSAPDPERAIPGAPAPKVKPIKAPTYEADFESFWNGTSKVGSKADALKAWLAVGRPTPEALIASWAAWNTIAWPDGIGVKHVSTWLRAFDWQQQPTPRPRAGAGPPARAAPAPAKPGDPAYLCRFHLDARTTGRKAWTPEQGCSECRHVAAKERPRTETTPEPAFGGAR